MSPLFWIWLAIMILSIIIEVATTELISFWFAIGALIALIMSIIWPNQITAQIVVFSVISVVCIVVLKPIFVKKFDSPKIPTNIDSAIGMKVYVTHEIDSNIPGEVKMDGVYWTAVSNKPIAVGELVEVVGVEGNKLIVK